MNVMNAIQRLKDRFVTPPGDEDTLYFCRILARMVHTYGADGKSRYAEEGEIATVMAFHAMTTGHTRFARNTKRVCLQNGIDFDRISNYVNELKFGIFSAGDIGRGEMPLATIEHQHKANQARLAVEWTTLSPAAENTLGRWRAYWRMQADERGHKPAGG